MGQLASSSSRKQSKINSSAMSNSPAKQQARPAAKSPNDEEIIKYENKIKEWEVDTQPSVSPPLPRPAAKRPSDEEIIKYENEIREREVNTQPLVSPPLPVSILREEYNDYSPFLSKIYGMDGRFAVMRKTRGDGNCFFRSFAFAFVEELVKQTASLTQEEFEKIKTYYNDLILACLKEASFDRMAYEDFFEEFGTVLDGGWREEHQGRSVGEFLETEWSANAYKSHSLVVLLRLLASAHLRTNAQEYEPFLWELAETMGDVRFENGMVDFCQRFVECLGVESDQIHIIVLSKVLRVDIDLAYLDGSEGPLGCIHFEGAPAQLATSDAAAETQVTAEAIQIPRLLVTLLYRPGHYDILYPL